jgi:osmoprotectant transport system permease protein
MRCLPHNLAALLVLLAMPARAAERHDLRVGSKAFTESVILGELATQLARSGGAAATHERQLGGTRILFNALQRGQLDLYPEYTGTITQEILPGQNIRTEQQIRDALTAKGISMTRPLGFNNSYAIGMRKDAAQKLGIQTISDLAQRAELKFGFSNEFMDRRDGWPALRDRYRLPQTNVRGLDHDLAYRALAANAIQATDLYSTDAEIAYYDLLVLKDDLEHFPRYEAVYLYRADLAARFPEAVRTIRRLEGKIDELAMTRMNARAKLEKVPEARVAADFLADSLGLDVRPDTVTAWRRIAQRTREHLFLVGVSLAAAILVALPLGIAAAKRPRFGQIILGTVAAIYTIPSLALLVFMIPLLGIGAWPAIVALFLYSLLPIVRNTQQGLREIPLPMRESAEVLGLSPSTKLFRIEMPLASGAILAGIKTSAVINIGTATLGALIGAGGYGQPILTGIRLDDLSLILQGAIPAALLALLVQGMFEMIELVVVPRGLRLKAESPVD